MERREEREGGFEVQKEAKEEGGASFVRRCMWPETT